MQKLFGTIIVVLLVLILVSVGNATKEDEPKNWEKCSNALRFEKYLGYDVIYIPSNNSIVPIMRLSQFA